jgi:hypothetical protein
MIKSFRRNVEYILYLFGVFILGLFDPWLDASLQPPSLILVVVVGWLVLLRTLGRVLKKKGCS